MVLLNRPWMLPDRRSALLKTYLTASDVGLSIPRADGEKRWRQIPRDQALTLMATMLAGVDSTSDLGGDAAEVSRHWAAAIQSPILRQQVQVGVTLGSLLIAPQLILLAIREALPLCPVGPPVNSTEGVDHLIACLLGIADEQDTGRCDDVTGQAWAGMDPVIAADLIANHHFNASTPLPQLMASAERTWRQPWPELAPPVEQSRVGGGPAELFTEATGLNPTVLLDVAVHLLVQRQVHGFLRFPDRFFNELGMSTTTRRAVLRLICTDIPSLQRALSSPAGWAFDPVRRWPLLRLDNGEILVLRLGWLMERSMSDVALLDIHRYLQAADASNGSQRAPAFGRCVQAKLEADVGDSLRRAFDRRGGDVWHETDLTRAFSPFLPRSQPPKLCDFAVRVGSTWLLVDATDRPLPAHVTDGSTGPGGLHTELRQALTGHKALQLESTIQLLRRHMDALTGERVDPGAVFIPIVATARGGLLWGWTVAPEAASQLADRGLLQGDDVMHAALMSPKDLSLLEREAQYRGVRAIDTVQDWRAGQHSQWGFDQYLHLIGRRLAATKSERRDADLLVRKAIQRARTQSQAAARP